MLFACNATRVTWKMNDRFGLLDEINNLRLIRVRKGGLKESEAKRERACCLSEPGEESQEETIDAIFELKSQESQNKSIKQSKMIHITSLCSFHVSCYYRCTVVEFVSTA
jgi:hypothetical protein